jgi:hypothetical protein
MRSVSMTMPSRVLMTDRPSAPALTHAIAMDAMSVTSGESLANTGMPGAVFCRTACTTSTRRAGRTANTCPRSSTFGQLMFTSTIARPGRPRSFWASRRSRRRCRRDRHDGARAAVGQPRQVVVEEGVDAGPCSRCC